MLKFMKNLGRSEKSAPFLTRISWASEWLPTKMDGPKPVERVKSGPYLALRLMRTDSKFKGEFVSRRKLEWRRDGPGGSFLPYLRWDSVDRMRAATQRETTIMNQVSIVDKEGEDRMADWRFSLRYAAPLVVSL
ncbi:hypothetical protein L1987_57244 [Smallanthus sonchifolius]|uniref:Uncharacterized protein n=1 Tax=Smallanthus sonchifolius TaxID=185202 RepID=A0ACB9DCR0_9ASTR|nr:hypothetical protein L1987_57244 [Smallanthus sonchifolius]